MTDFFSVLPIAALVLLPIGAAIAGILLTRAKEKPYYRLALAVTFAEFVLSLVLALCPGCANEWLIGGVTGHGLGFQVDGFRRVYCVIIAFMWWMTMLLSRDYFNHHHKLSRYFFFNLITLGAIEGVFLARDLFTALVFFEIMSFASFPWVLQEETDEAKDAANIYLAIAVIGGMVSLMGLFLLESRLGTLVTDELYEAAKSCPDKTALYIAGGCILFGFGAKAGMFPLHIWLPKAHPVAPAPASALLSGVLTKSGIWGIIAISSNIFRHDPAWGTVLAALGAVTMLLGAVLALLSVNLKRTLACSSMSQIGFILTGIAMSCLLGEENALAARGTLLHMVNHSLFKLVLFQCAGIVYMQAHTLDLNELKGFGRNKPFLRVCFLLGALGIGGIPGLNGYISKTLLHESIVEAASEYGTACKILEWVFLFSGGLTLGYMTKLYICLFREHGAGETLRHGTKPTWLSVLPVAGSTALLPILGLGANRLMNGLADIGTDFLHGAPLKHAIYYYSLENLKGAAISVAIGAAVYLVIVRLLLMRRDGTYRDILAGKPDLTSAFYKPLINTVLPAVLGAVAVLFGENRITAWLYRQLTRALSALAALFGENRITAWLCALFFRIATVLTHAVSDLTDGIAVLLRKCVFRPLEKPVSDGVHTSAPYRFGAVWDALAIRRGKAPRNSHRHAERTYRAFHTVRQTTHNLLDSLSLPLLILCIALCVAFVYLFFIR